MPQKKKKKNQETVLWIVLGVGLVAGVILISTL